MYELKCPSCGHGIKSPFVRIGAIVDCLACQHRYRVDDKHLRRVIRRLSKKSGLAMEEFVEARIGLSGLSDVMSRSTSASPQRATRPKPGPLEQQAHTPDQGSRHRVVTRKKLSRDERIDRHKRHRRATHTLLGTTILIASAVGILITLWASLTYGPSLLGTDPQTPNHTPEQLATRNGIRQKLGTWQSVSGGYERPIYANTDINLFAKIDRTDPQEPFLRLEVHPLFSELIHRAMVELVIVNAQNDQRLKTHMELAILNADHPRIMHILLPADLVRPNERIEAYIDTNTISYIDDPYWLALDEVEIRPIPAPEQEHAKLEISLDAKPPRPMDRVVFLINGLNADQQIIHAWHLEWITAIDTQQTMQFHAQLPLPDNMQMPVSWQIEAVGNLAQAPAAP